MSSEHIEAVMITDTVIEMDERAGLQVTLKLQFHKDVLDGDQIRAFSNYSFSLAGVGATILGVMQVVGVRRWSDVVGKSLLVELNKDGRKRGVGATYIPSVEAIQSLDGRLRFKTAAMLDGSVENS